MKFEKFETIEYVLHHTMRGRIEVEEWRNGKRVGVVSAVHPQCLFVDHNPVIGIRKSETWWKVRILPTLHSLEQIQDGSKVASFEYWIERGDPVRNPLIQLIKGDSREELFDARIAAQIMAVLMVTGHACPPDQD